MTTKIAAVMTGLALAVTIFSTGGAAANTPRTGTPSAGVHHQGSSITPLAMQFFCAQHRNECASGGAAQVAMTPNLAVILDQVNKRVNRSIRAVADTGDVWSLNPTSGDCEDFALSKRSALIRQGISGGALRIAYTHTSWGEPHAVLVVKTSQGSYVLDNLTNTIKTLSSSGYVVKSMSSQNPTRWIAG